MATVVTVSGKGSPLTATEMDANFTNLNTDKLDDAASNGSQFIRQNGAWSNFTVDALVETSSTKPSNPVDGHAWFSESNGVTYVYDSASGDWVAVGASSGESGVRSMSAMQDVSLASTANGDSLNYDSASSNWNNSNLNSYIFTSSFGTTQLTSGVWLVDVRMSITEGGAAGGVPSVFIYIQTRETALDAWVYEIPYPNINIGGYAAIGNNPSINPVEGAWVKLISVPSTYFIKTSYDNINATSTALIELTAVKVGDV